MTRLLFDYARCEGAGQPPCNDCLRRLSPGHPEYQWYTLPPEFNGDDCRLRIPPKGQTHEMRHPA
ncbi:MAG: hypothetical protein Q4F13_08935 [Pseudomonadota bacterium]|nr:hypothetical protein [Pseudomonadota bacterium]